MAVRRVPALPLLVLLLLLLPACSGDDGDDGDGDDASGGTEVSPGLIVAQQLAEGDLADTLELLDPERPGDETVDVDDVSRGIPVGVQQALYESGAEIVLLDAETGEVQDLGLQIGDIDLAYSRASVAQGGERWVVLLAPTGEGAALVDLEDGGVTDLVALLDGPQFVLGAEMAPDGSMVLLNTEDGVHVVPTEDPEAAERAGDGAGQLVDGGASILLTSADGVVVRDLESGDETEISGGDGGALAVGDRVLVGQGTEAVLLDPGSDEVIASAPFSTDGAAPVAVGDTVLLPGSDEPTWTLVDGDAGTATPLPELDGLTPAFSGRPERWVPFGNEEGQVLVGVDTQEATVQPILDLEGDERFVGLPAVAGTSAAGLVSVTDPDGTHGVLVDLAGGTTQELGSGLQGAAFSPDGGQVVWSDSREGVLRIATVDDVEGAEVVGEGLVLPVWLNGG